MKHVFVEGDARIDDKTGILLRPGAVEITDDEVADDLIAREVCREATDEEIEATAEKRDKAAADLEEASLKAAGDAASADAKRVADEKAAAPAAKTTRPPAKTTRPRKPRTTKKR